MLLQALPFLEEVKKLSGYRKRRYLAIKIEMENTPSRTMVMDAILDNLLRLFGEYGSSKIDLLLVDYDTAKKQLILRCSRDAVHLLRAAVMSVTRIDGMDMVYLKVISISGTLKALRRKLETLKHIPKELK